MDAHILGYLAGYGLQVSLVTHVHDSWDLLDTSFFIHAIDACVTSCYSTSCERA